jgi:predicted lysophospholipase L1 biosynthesis ABC-type transport system permease subunit
MASTGGGFLLGFGLCLLLVSLIAIAGASAAYKELKERESTIAMLYSVTHSSGYQKRYQFS